LILNQDYFINNFNKSFKIYKHDPTTSTMNIQGRKAEKQFSIEIFIM